MLFYRSTEDSTLDTGLVSSSLGQPKMLRIPCEREPAICILPVAHISGLNFSALLGVFVPFSTGGHEPLLSMGGDLAAWIATHLPKDFT